MKLLTVYTESHRSMYEEWFLPSIVDNYEVISHFCEVEGGGKYMEKDWTKAVLFKSQKIIETIKKNWGNVFVYSDVDIEFFGATEHAVVKSLGDKDIVCQLDDPSETLCTGFFGIRANDATLKLWEEVYECVKIKNCDQFAFNNIIRATKDIKFGYLPCEFFGTGTYTGTIWEEGAKFYIPKSPLMFHANFTVGVDNKIILLKRAKEIVNKGYISIAINNARFFLNHGFKGKKVISDFYKLHK